MDQDRNIRIVDECGAHALATLALARGGPVYVLKAVGLDDDDRPDTVRPR